MFPMIRLSIVISKLIMLLSLPQTILDQLEWIYTAPAVLYLIVIIVAVMTGTTFGVAIKHIQAKNFEWCKEDKWFYLLGFALTFGLFLWQVDPSMAFGISTSLKTILGFVQNKRNGIPAAT